MPSKALGASIALALIALSGSVAVNVHLTAQRDHARTQATNAQRAAAELAQQVATAQASAVEARNRTSAAAGKDLGTIAGLQRQVTALRTQVVQLHLDAQRPPPAPAETITLTDPASLSGYLWSACEVAVGAGATPAGQNSFTDYIHQQERAQGEARLAGRESTIVDPIADAAAYAHGTAGACY